MFDENGPLTEPPTEIAVPQGQYDFDAHTYVLMHFEGNLTATVANGTPTGTSVTGAPNGTSGESGLPAFQYPP